MRFILWGLGIFCAVIVVAVIVFIQISNGQDVAAKRFVPPTSSATPSATAPALTAQQKLDQEIATDVNLYGQLICNKLAESPTANINTLVTKFIALYGSATAPADAQLATAHTMLLDATNQFCPDQTPRVTAGIAAG
jgi:hypothetical protein